MLPDASGTIGVWDAVNSFLLLSASTVAVWEDVVPGIREVLLLRELCDPKDASEIALRTLRTTDSMVELRARL
jgi:hypothetical protein